MPSVFETVTRAVVQELDAGGDMIGVRSVIDAEKFHCFCLVRGKKSFFTQRYCGTDLTLQDILEYNELDSGLQGSKAEFQVADRVDSKGCLAVKLPSYIKLGGDFHGSHSHELTMLKSKIPQEYLKYPQKWKLKSNLPTLFQSIREMGGDLYLVTESLKTTKEETLTSERQYHFWKQLDSCTFNYEHKHKRAVTIPPETVLGYRVKQLVFNNMETMTICFSGREKSSFPEEEDGGSSCLGKDGSQLCSGGCTSILEPSGLKDCSSGKSLSLEDFRNMKEKVQDTVRGLQDLTGEEREDVLSCFTKCLTADKDLQDLEKRVISGELQMEGPADPLMSSLFNPAGVLIEARREAILEFLDALKELSEEKELLAESLEKGTLPLLKDQVESILEQTWGQRPPAVGCDPEAQALCALYLAVSVLLQLSEKPASVPS